MNVLDFLLLRDPSIQLVVLGVVLLGAGAGLVGVFAYLRKRSLAGDVVAHSILPGICLAFLLSGTKNPWWLLLGAALTGWLSLLAIDVITSRSKLKTDTATGLVLSVFFGVGIMLLTAIQHTGNAAQAGLDSYLFGKAASMNEQDVLVFGSIAALLMITVALFYKPLKLVSFNPDFARSMGLPVRFYEFLLSTLTVLAVSSGIQAVGVVLMAALLITPAATARFWTERLPVMIGLSMLVGALAGYGGAFISYLAPAMPTGPWVVMVLSALVLLSAAVAPGKGLIARAWQRRENVRKILLENILKAFYHLGESNKSFYEPRALDTLLAARSFNQLELHRGLNQLQRKRLVNHSAEGWKLTSAGLTEAQRVVRLHRLWELYLTQRVQLAADHVHTGAEAIEHVITPEIEAALERELGFPAQDPHASMIPMKTNPDLPT